MGYNQYRRLAQGSATLSYLLGASLLWLVAAPFLIFPDTMPVMTVVGMASLLVVRIIGQRWTGYLFPRTILNELILLLLILSIVSFLISPFPLNSLPWLTILFLGVFVYYICTDWINLSSTNRADGLRPATVLLAICGAALAIAMPFIIDWPERQIFNVTSLIPRIPHLSGGYYFHHGPAAGILITLFPFVLLFGWKKVVSRPIRILAWGISIWLIIMILLTQSRSAALALVTMFLALLIWSRIRLRWLFAGVGALAGIILVVYFASNATLADLSQLALLFDEASKSFGDAPGSWPMRAEIWSAAIKIFWEYPVTGVGLDMLVPVSRLHYAFEVTTHDYTHAHNIFLQSAADFGWAGMLIIAEILGVLLFGLWQAGRRSRSFPDEEQIESRENRDRTIVAASPLSRIWFGLRLDRQFRIYPAELIVTYGVALVGFTIFNLLDVLSFWQRPGIFTWLILAGSAALVADARVLPRWTRALALAPVVLLIVLLFSPAMSRNLENLRLDRARLLNDSLSSARAGWLDEHPRGAAAYHSGDESAALDYSRHDPKASHYMHTRRKIAEFVPKHQAAPQLHGLASASANRKTEIYFWRGRCYRNSG